MTAAIMDCPACGGHTHRHCDQNLACPWRQCHTCRGDGRRLANGKIRWYSTKWGEALTIDDQAPA